MENAVDSLKMAFAVFVFVMALSIVMYMFTQAKATADVVLESSDVSGYMEYIELEDNKLTIEGDRIVGLETIIPTLYKYYKENYTVIFRNADGSFMELYKTPIKNWSPEYINKYDIDDYSICSFDVDEEYARYEPWIGSNITMKENLDHFLEGGKYTYQTSNGTIEYDYGKGFIEKYKDYKFRESLGEYTYGEVSKGNDEAIEGTTQVKPKKKRVIIYTLQN